MKLDSSIAAVVTGGASGLGEATVRALAAQGVKCAIFDMNEAKGEAVAKEVGGVFCKVNVTSEEEVDAAFAKAARQGRLCAAWTPHSAASMLRWVIKGLCSEWLLFGRRFDIAAEGGEALRRLFSSFATAPAR